MTDRGVLLLDFLNETPLPGRVLFAKIWGSHSHGTELPESDVDYLAVYACSPAELLGLSPPPDTVSKEAPDYQAHEARKFAALIRKGNPGVIECLFTERWFVDSPEWRALRELRTGFLNQTTLKQYLGYCRGQLHRLDAGTRLHTRGGKFNTKWAYHMVRLALDAERIAQGDPPVVFKEGAENELLMEVRAGRYEPSELATMFQEIEARIDGCKPWAIPERVEERSLNNWLMDVYSLTPEATAQ